MNPLDRPVWATLNSYHLPLSIGGALARRFLPDVNLFASSRDESPESLSALSAMVSPAQQIYLAQAATIVVPPGLQAVRQARCVQMVAARPFGHMPAHQHEIRKLTDVDAPDMLALATLTQPGPFLARTHRMGTFRGIHIDGRLAAMAGERFRFPGYTEISGVCTHPDFRGRGLARILSAVAAADIETRAERPFLHAWTTNRSAIALYESMGFELRAEIDVAVLERSSTP
jgi:predicted GNAT family acetyltransferase